MGFYCNQLEGCSLQIFDSQELYIAKMCTTVKGNCTILKDIFNTQNCAHKSFH